MINPKELRIGNWVLDTIYLEEDEIGKPLKIEYFHFTQPGDYFSPIPLTPEILEKAGFRAVDAEIEGFTRVHGRPFYSIVSKSQIFTLTDEPYGVWHYIDFPYTRLQYLHQLQNLYFALTGEDLNIEL